jgi:hypothetical protein
MAPDDDDEDEEDEEEDDDVPPDDRNRFEIEEPYPEFDLPWAVANNLREVQTWRSDDLTLQSSSQVQAHHYEQHSLAGDARFNSPQDHHYDPASMHGGSPYWQVEGQTQAPSYDNTRSQYEQTNPAPGFAQEYRQSPHRTVEPKHLEGPFGNLRLRGGPQYPAPQQQQYGLTPVPPPLY